jgi:hypothetical protein
MLGAVHPPDRRQFPCILKIRNNGFQYSLYTSITKTFLDNKKARGLFPGSWYISCVLTLYGGTRHMGDTKSPSGRSSTAVIIQAHLYLNVNANQLFVAPYQDIWNYSLNIE